MPFRYRDLAHLIESLDECVISPSLAAVNELEEGGHRIEMERAAWEAQNGSIREDLKQT